MTVRSRLAPLALISLFGLVAAAPALAALDCATTRILGAFPVTGDTSTRPNTADAYACGSSAYAGPGVKSGYTGGEDVWLYSLSSTATVVFQLEAANPDMRVLVLNGCDENQCQAEGGCGENLDARDYHVVVDGRNGAGGPTV